MSNYPPGVHAGTPDAPWNLSEGEDAQETIDTLDGQALWESGNHDVDGSLDALGTRITFAPAPAYSTPWRDLSDAERELFESYAAVVRGFAALYERGIDR